MRRIAIIAFTAAIFVGLAAPAAIATPVHCVQQTHRGACHEPIWVHGVEVTMTFPHAGDPVGGGHGNRNTDAMTFYVVAPQTSTPQATLPFVHDHVVPAMPGEAGYRVYLEGYVDDGLVVLLLGGPAFLDTISPSK